MVHFEKTQETITGTIELLLGYIIIIFQINSPAAPKLFGIAFLLGTGSFLLSTGMKRGKNPKHIKKGF